MAGRADARTGGAGCRAPRVRFSALRRTDFRAMGHAHHSATSMGRRDDRCPPALPLIGVAHCQIGSFVTVQTTCPSPILPHEMVQ